MICRKCGGTIKTVTSPYFVQVSPGVSLMLEDVERSVCSFCGGVIFTPQQFEAMWDKREQLREALRG